MDTIEKDRESFLSDLKMFAHSNVLFVPNPGNAGDAIIAEATYQLFNQCDISYQIITEFDEVRLRGQILILGGGGSLVQPYTGMKNWLRKTHALVRQLIIFPQTISMIDELLNELGPNVLIYCRERISYEYALEKAINANVKMAPDLAFYIDLSLVPRPRYFELFSYVKLPLVTSSKKNKWLSWRSMIYIWKSRVRHFIQYKRFGERGVLNVFRVDGERTDMLIPIDNLDVSNLYSFGTQSRQLSQAAASHFIELLSSYSHIRTNRLHVAIVSSILGKKVTLFNNSYYKNKAVFEYAIKDKYPHVEFFCD